MIPHDLFDWTNSGAGVAGLVLTAGAIWQATSAKRAATEARKAVNKRNAADAMVEVVRIAEQLNTSVLYERPLKPVSNYASWFFGFRKIEKRLRSCSHQMPID
jgi:ribosomal protein L31E